ncbi:hypothetical protein ACHAXH_005049 [Discostella pseudostelligera]
MMIMMKVKASRRLYIAVYIVLFARTLLLVNADGADDFDCDSSACTNGMFNQATCSCECIPPFCPDMYGNCIVAGTCDDPWSNCEQGYHAADYYPRETKPVVPPGTWKIFPTEETCCKASFPYSKFCIKEPKTIPPTKYPTITLIEDDEEIIPIQFSVSGITHKVSIHDISDEMEIVLKRILLRLAEKIEELKVMKVESIVAPVNLRRRELEEEYILYFHVYVVRNDKKKFGPYIIQGIKDLYNDVLSEIQAFSDTNQLTGDSVINFCTLRNGMYDLCVIDKDPPHPAPAVRSPTGTIVYVDPTEGLAGWAIALIVVLILTIVFCTGYWIGVIFFGVANCCKDHNNNGSNNNNNNNNKGKEFHNNIFLDGSRGPHHLPLDYERRLTIMPDSRSRDDRSRNSEKLLSLTYCGDRRSSQESNYCEDPLEEEQSFHDSFITINSYKHRPSRDRTMYIPGQEGRPDPDSLSTFQSLGSNGSRRYYSEEPPSKP